MKIHINILNTFLVIPTVQKSKIVALKCCSSSCDYVSAKFQVLVCLLITENKEENHTSPLYRVSYKSLCTVFHDLEC